MILTFNEVYKVLHSSTLELNKKKKAAGGSTLNPSQPMTNVLHTVEAVVYADVTHVAQWFPPLTLAQLYLYSSIKYICRGRP